MAQQPLMQWIAPIVLHKQVVQGGEEWSPWFPCFTNRFGGPEDKKDLTYIYALILLSSIYYVYERFEKNQCEVKQEKQIEGNSPHELV
jgi:hypothetical protein